MWMRSAHRTSEQSMTHNASCTRCARGAYRRCAVFGVSPVVAHVDTLDRRVGLCKVRLWTMFHPCAWFHRIMSHRAGGAVIYMPQEGRGIGLSNKIKAYHLQETEGLDTVDANRALGLPDDARSYDAVPGILKTLGVPPGGSIRLLTNNPRKVRELEKLGVTVAAMVPCVVESNAHNSGYLHAKSTRMDHHLPHATCTHGTSSALKSKL
eukprot:m.283242 g.283242  ORF g.283242 m.283242 type:complete len:209 (-) comp19874_c0_seq3:103-729(-)